MARLSLPTTWSFRNSFSTSKSISAKTSKMKNRCRGNSSNKRYIARSCCIVARVSAELVQSWPSTTSSKAWTFSSSWKEKCLPKIFQGSQFLVLFGGFESRDIVWFRARASMNSSTNICWITSVNTISLILNSLETLSALMMTKMRTKFNRSKNNKSNKAHKIRSKKRQ